MVVGWQPPSSKLHIGTLMREKIWAKRTVVKSVPTEGEAHEPTWWYLAPKDELGEQKARCHYWSWDSPGFVGSSCNVTLSRGAQVLFLMSALLVIFIDVIFFFRTRWLSLISNRRFQQNVMMSSETHTLINNKNVLSSLNTPFWTWFSYLCR